MYDFLYSDENKMSVAIADVIGKGMPAAMMMSMLRGTLRAYTEGGYQRHTVAEVIDRLNRTCCRECRSGEFITLLLARIDIEEMKITYCNCGHEPAVLIRNGKCFDLNKGGLVLGLMKDAKYDIESVKLKDGDTLLFYTDGLIDAANFEQELWGRERMLEVAKHFTAGSAKKMVDNLISYRRRFIGLSPQNDDTSIVVVKVDRRAEPVFMER